ncbi:transporter substrate-binding domain-containing protein [Enterobacter cloacae complex sp. P42RS]|nr:transporter substrate-binding domain-containing protein [Enterobacter cloacae complex sp. P42RS]
MKFALLGRQALMGVMAVALVAGMSVKTFAAENLLNKVKERGTLLVGLEGTYPPFSFQGDDGKLTGFEVEFAEELAKHLGVKASLKPTKWDGMLASRQKVNEISEQLNLSPKTVNSYRYRMFSKLNIHGDVELTHLAIRHGLCNAETLLSQ